MEASALDVQRRSLEEIDRLERAIVEEVLDRAKTHKNRIVQELTVGKMLSQIGRTCKAILKQSQDENEVLKREIESLTVTSEFGDFYNRLKLVKDAHRRSPNERPVDDTEFESLFNSCRVGDDQMESLFSGEESYGKFLDMHFFYGQYVNLKSVRRMDYLNYLAEFDNFDAIPFNTKVNQDYSNYLKGMTDYLESYLARAKPLFDLAPCRQSAIDSFDSKWTQGQAPGWEKISESLNHCDVCDHYFTNKSVYEAHIPGKKHQRALSRVVQSASKHSLKQVAMHESLIVKYIEILSQVREDTRANVEHKQSRTFEEREEDIVEEDIMTEVPVVDEENDGRIYNPLNLPLDWDGKPIPFWLWKLHGLGIRFPCEVCGNHVYMGRKAFDQHFFEWRHSNGMKALGVPNTKHFFQITNIEEALSLWEKLKRESRTETFRPESMEEFEDQYGNVYNRKTYEDLRRQGPGKAKMALQSLSKSFSRFLASGRGYINAANYPLSMPTNSATDQRDALEKELASTPELKEVVFSGEAGNRHVRCYNCGEIGHMSYSCTLPQVRKACYNCGNTGHVSRECPQKARITICFHCRKTGHMLQNCPDRIAGLPRAGDDEKYHN